MRKCLLLTILSISILIVQAKTIYYVKVGGNGAGTTWANASSNLQTVIDNSISGDEIWVAQGTYYPTKELTVGSPRTKTFVIKNGVSIFGGFSGSETSLNQRILSDLNQDGKVDSCEFTNETILSGNTDGVNDNWTKTISSDGKTWSWTIIGNSNNCYRIITPNAIFTTPTYIDGFTITASNGNITTIRGGGISMNANVNVLNCKFSNCFAYEGGAAYGEGGIMRNCEITNCQSDNSGGGIFLNSTSYSNYCTFEKNSVNNCVTLNGNGGGIYSATKDSKIINCLFENCCSSTESGGGLYTNSEIKECIINNCSAKKDGGGIYTGGEMINLSRNLIENCSALSGGGISYTASQGTSSRIFIDNCLILNCFANSYGGGIKQSTGVSRLYIVNCTIVNCNSTYGGGVSSASLLNTAIYNCNAASYGGAAFFGDAYSNDIKNCAFGNNTANGVLSNIYGISTTDFITSDVATTFIQPTSFIGTTSTQNQQTEVNSSNWELKSNSACINIGNQQTESYILTEKDLSGNLRLYGNSIDIGAYEFHNTTGLNNITSENIHIQIIDSKLVLTPKHIGDRLSIYDLNGKLILSKTETINLTKKGIYIVHIESSNKSETIKVIM